MVGQSRSGDRTAKKPRLRGRCFQRSPPAQIGLAYRAGQRPRIPSLWGKGNTTPGSGRTAFIKALARPLFDK